MTVASNAATHMGVPIWFVAALGEYGTAEVAGAASNPKITQYLRTTSLPAEGLDDETPWCSAFVNWCMVQSGHKGTGSAAARSWLTWGKRVTVPQIGTVTVLWRETPSSGKGHVAFFVRRDGHHVWLLSGNQGNRVSIERYPAVRVLDFRTV